MELVQSIARWLHIIAGVMWIGLLYFFNFINVHFAATLDADSKKKVVPEYLIKKFEAIPDIWLCFALIKSKNINYLVEKVSEIGLKKIIPIAHTKITIPKLLINLFVFVFSTSDV